MLLIRAVMQLINSGKEEGKERLNMNTVRKIFLVGVFALTATLILAWGNGAEVKAAKKVSLKKAKITLSKKSYTYDGKKKKPSVTVKIGKKKIKKKYYTIKYTKNKKPGTAKVTVKAKKGKSSKYTDSKAKTFKIKKASRKLIPDRNAYSAVEGDGAFNIVAKPSKGSGTVTYSCSTTNVIKVTKAGKVTVVKKFDRNCKNLSKTTKDTIKKATAKVKMSIPANAYYTAASKTVTVTINKKPVRKVDTVDSIKNYKYPTLQYACETKKLTDLDWSVVTKYQVPGLAPTADDDWIKEYVQCNNLCPQGICIAGDYMLTTAYCMDSVHNSCIFIYNNKTGAYLRTLVLKDQKTHVGGITYDSKNKIIWVCHSKKDKTGLYSLQRITYSELCQYAAGQKSCVLSSTANLQKITTKPSTIAYCEKDGYIWIAQFSDPAASQKNEDEENEEETANDATNEAKMYAYEYKNGKLVQVRQVNNTAIEDYLGVHTTDATREIEQEGEIVTEKVVVIDEVYTNKGVLAKVDLTKGDILYKVGTQRIETGEQLENLLAGCKEGDILNVEICRTVEKQDTVSGSAIQVETTEVLKDQLTIGTRGEIVSRVIPAYVQGVTFTKSGKTIFSCSYGRNTTKKKFVSQLLVYGATEENNPSGMGDIELAVALPPMVEEVEMVGDEVYMIFESAATKYLEGTDGKGQSMNPIDKIVAVKFKLEVD